MLLTISSLVLIALLLLLILTSKKHLQLRNTARPKYKMSDWMGMTAEQRRLSDDKEKRFSLKRKQMMLSEIRKEYQALQKRNRNK